MTRRLILMLTACAVALAGAAPAPADDDPADDGAARLVAAMLGDTPLIEDLRQLTDEIGGRATGSTANERSVAWGLERFREARVAARAEPFEMPALWLETTATAVIDGDGVRFAPRIAAMPFSADTPEGGLTAPLVDAGAGAAADFARLGEAAAGAFALVSTPILEDIPGLFEEYVAASGIEDRALAAGAAGLVYMGSRPGNQLYRHNASYGIDNEHPMVVMSRDAATRALRLMAAGITVTMTVDLDLVTGGAYTSHNVIGEIRGGELPDEYVVIGAHLDSWDIGTGALDNGCNVALVIDVARQIQRLGLTPRRTIRFALWNGEEQGLYGSWAYNQAHEDELDGHVMAASFDTGSGRIRGFLTNGRLAEMRPVLDTALEPVAGLGPFTHTDVAIYGTDHFDFVLEGIAGLVADQESANYGPNYHARPDTFDKVDQEQLKLNSAIAAALVWGYANADISWGRLDRAGVQRIIDGGLAEHMTGFRVMKHWQDGSRGRHRVGRGGRNRAGKRTARRRTPATARPWRRWTCAGRTAEPAAGGSPALRPAASEAAQVELQPRRNAGAALRPSYRVDDVEVRAAVAVQVQDARQPEMAQLAPEADLPVRQDGIAAAGSAQVDRHLLAAPQLDEVGAAVAVEVAGELRQVADPEVLEVELEPARQVEAGHLAKAAVRRLAPDVEVHRQADPP